MTLHPSHRGFDSSGCGLRCSTGLRETVSVSTEAASLRTSVRDAYSGAATDPTGRHPFPVGAQFARSLGYPEAILNSIPASSVEGFTGVSNVSVFASLPESSTVLDLGCGAGLDAFIAAQRTGPRGQVIGIDFSAEMLSRANSSRRQLNLSHLVFVLASAEQLPLRDASVDHVLVNGLFNLNPYRDQIFDELARVLKPEGSVFGAELILQAPLASTAGTSAANWFS